MRRLCERPGCVGSAEVSYGIDNANLTVWLDHNHVPEREHAGRLCRRHADALVVPRGWTVDDRRQPVPRLFHEPDRGSSTSETAPKSARKRSPGRSPALTETPEVEPTLFEQPTTDPDETRALSWSISALDQNAPSEHMESEDTDTSESDDAPVFGRLMGRAFRRPGS